MSDNPVTVADIEREARALLGVPFRHQGIDPRTGGIDCKAVPEWVAFRLWERPLPMSYNYARQPEAAALRAGLEQEMEEVAVESARAGDVVLIRWPRDREARHVGVLVEGAFELMIVHAYEADSPGYVVEEPYRPALRRWTIAAFRFRGVIR